MSPAKRDRWSIASGDEHILPRYIARLRNSVVLELEFRLLASFPPGACFEKRGPQRGFDRNGLDRAWVGMLYLGRLEMSRARQKLTMMQGEDEVRKEKQFSCHGLDGDSWC